MDQSSLNRFLTTYAWDETKLNRRRIQYLQEHEETKWKTSGVIDIDDTLREKTGEDIPGVAKFYDHSKGEYTLAQDLVTASYTDVDVHYPVDVRLYFKKGSKDTEKHGFKTKIELAMELVDECEKMATPAQNYVFDSWFLSEEFAEHIESYGKYWLSRLKSNRNVYPFLLDILTHINEQFFVALGFTFCTHLGLGKTRKLRPTDGWSNLFPHMVTYWN